LGQVLKEPAFEPKVITFAIWRLTNEMKYKSGNVRFPKRTSGDPDGSEYLLSVLDGNPETYVKFASDYYESPIPIAPVRKIYGHEPLLAETVQELSKERSVVAVMRRARALGFKTSR
jgi:hypothetical protein